MKHFSILMLVTIVCFAPAAWPQAEPQEKTRIITFDAPGAGTGAGQGTLPIGIVQGDWIMGSYIDAGNVSHGFLRTPWGTFVTFDAPGAGQGAGQGTVEVHGMNEELEIVGTYADADNVYHGFVRSPAGSFATFECPGAGTGAFQGTAAHSVNAAGLISAEYLDATGVWHGCVRDREGHMTVYDPKDAGMAPGSGQGTYPAIFSGITPEGAIIGEYLDANYVLHAYLRATDGTITEFDDPNAGAGVWQGSGTSGINPEGEINGWYIDANNVFHGFLRWPDGRTMTRVDVPGSGTGPCQGTDGACYMPSLGGITPAGEITGFYADSNSVYHGFVRTARGEIVEFDVEGAGTGGWQGTLPLNINPEGAVTGWYIDNNNVYHGFLRTAGERSRWWMGCRSAVRR